MASKFTCPHCDALQEVDPDLPVDGQDCIHCGMPLVDTAFAEYPVSRRRPVEEDNRQEEESDLKEPAHVPGAVIAAGILWILFGCIQTLASLLSVAPGRDDAMADRTARASKAAFTCAMALIGVVFILVAIRCIRGTAKDILGISIGSLILGVLYTCAGVVALSTTLKELSNVAAILVILFLAVPPNLAGVLGLIARSDYKAFRRATQQSRRRRHSAE
jgi:hypothetical protein